ncbi:MAG: hypothetical protein IK016_03780 [Lachnospiraceae bacterium]|nr:hypothetical protein [Lachnospiraceae bacterium]
MEKNFSIKENRWKKAVLTGMEMDAEGRLHSTGKGAHVAVLPPIDSGEEDSDWGRLTFTANHDGETAHYVYALAVNDTTLLHEDTYVELFSLLSEEGLSRERKLEFLTELGASRTTNQSDILLYAQKGRYLFLVLSVIGDAEASFSGFHVRARGDNFMDTFPQVYRERNSFFHRYISVFSSIYNDFQEEIDALPKLLDLDSCPAEILPLYGAWLGIDLTGGFLEEEVLRGLVKEGYDLNRRRGTRKALTRIIEIVTGMKAEVVEYNMMRAYLLSDGAQIPDHLQGGGIYDVTILLHGHISDTKRHQLMFLLDQFKPVRAKLHLVQLDKTARMDGHTYMDMNAAIPSEKASVLDADTTLGDVIVLE